jgi:WD40 repeat protein
MYIISASGDRTIRLWDRRAANGGAGVLVGSATPGLLAHREMISSLAVSGHTLVSSSVDKSCVQWDLRVVARGPQGTTQPVATWGLDDHAVLVLGMGSERVGCAASTAGGAVFSLDVLSSGAAPPRKAAAFPSRTQDGSYRSLVWDPASDLLFGGYSVLDPRAYPDAPARLDIWRAY